jgi:thymidylate synthase
VLLLCVVFDVNCVISVFDVVTSVASVVLCCFRCFNCTSIASYALLTHLVAHVCNVQVGDFVHSFGDAHVYSNHIEGLEEQLKRKPLPFPQLILDASVKEIDQFTSESIKIEGYVSHPAIKLDMAL